MPLNIYPGNRVIYTGAEGTVVKWIECEESMKDFQDFVCVQLEKAEGAAGAYVGSKSRFFKAENLEKI